MMLICPVRPGDQNEELRYAMRSWQQNLLYPDGLRLLTVGHRPPWLDSDIHIDGNRYKSVPQNVWDNVVLGSEFAHNERGEDEVIYMNDDFFCMDPMTKVLPVRRNLTLEQHCALFPEQGGLWWPRSLRLTASWLAGAGFPHPVSYEVHRPLVASPERMISALARWDGGLEGDVPQWRTIYGVLNEIEAYPVGDVKLGVKVTGIGSPWISTSDTSWRKYKSSIMQRFQKPSRWEVKQ